MANPELTKILDTSNYIMFTVCKNKTDRDYYIAPLIPEKSIDIQFPRRVLAHVLNLPDRIHWDKCQQPKLKEMADCENFKSFYQNLTLHFKLFSIQFDIWYMHNRKPFFQLFCLNSTGSSV